MALAEDTAPKSAEPIQVFAAASATNAIGDIVREFTDKSGIEVRTVFGSSATLARQIVNGADADVLLSADPKWTDDLAKQGFVVTQRDMLGNSLVIVVPSDSALVLANPEDLLSAKITHIAIGEPSSVPAGKYAMKALARLGLWEAVKPKIAAAEDVRAALTYVETGAAEVGIVYATDAAISKKVKVAATIPESLTGPICYPIALLTHGKNNPTVRSFYQFLDSPASLNIFRKYGFLILPHNTPATAKPNE
jgi:molybdate transport system substrate-binding protein